MSKSIFETGDVSYLNGQLEENAKELEIIEIQLRKMWAIDKDEPDTAPTLCYLHEEGLVEKVRNQVEKQIQQGVDPPNGYELSHVLNVLRQIAKVRIELHIGTCYELLSEIATEASKDTETSYRKKAIYFMNWLNYLGEYKSRAEYFFPIDAK